jgi:hypothetical protein
MAERVWTFDIVGVYGLRVGGTPWPRVLIGRKLLRVLSTHALVGLALDQLGFSHGATDPVVTSYDIHVIGDSLAHSVLTDWSRLSVADTENPALFPDLIDVGIVGGTGTVNDPCPDLSAFADAFSGSPANASW